MSWTLLRAVVKKKSCDWGDVNHETIMTEVMSMVNFPSVPAWVLEMETTKAHVTWTTLFQSKTVETEII